MRRTVLVTVALLVAALVAWLAFLRLDVGSAGSSSSVETSSTSTPAKTKAPELETPASSPEARVIPAVDSPHIATTAAPAAPAIPDGLARLAVQVVARETKKPLAEWRVDVHPKEPGEGGWQSKHVDRPYGSMTEAPLTDDQGRAWIDCPPGTALTVGARTDVPGERGDNAETTVEPLAPGTERLVVVEVRFEPDTVLYVRALDAGTRAPLSEVHVRALQSAGWVKRSGSMERAPSDVLAEGRTDLDGLCRLDLRSWTRPHLELEGAGRARTLSPAPPGHDTPAKALEVTLQRTASLRGELVGARSGSIRLRTNPYELLSSDQRGMLMHVDAADPEWTAEVQPDGRFAFDALPPACELRPEYLTGSRAGGSKEEPRPIGENVRLAPDETRTVTWSFEGRCTIRGRVVDGRDAPVKDAELWLVVERSPHPHVLQAYSDEERRAARTRSDASGAFELTEVRAGAWQVGLAPSEPGEASASGCVGISERVTVTAEDALHEIVLHVDCDLFIEGRVVTPLGLPPSHAFVQAAGLAQPGFFHENVPKGAFKLGPVLRGRYQISATGTDHGPSEILEVEAGAKDVVLLLTPGASIEGRVIDDASTTGPFEIQIAAAEGSKARFSMMTTTTAPDGTFSLQGLEPGRYDVVASTSGGRYGVRRDVETVAGRKTEGLEVRLGPGARLRVKSSFDQGSIFVRCDGALIHVLQADETRPVECALPPGSIRVELVRYHRVDGQWKPETLSEKRIELLPGDVKDLEIEAPK